MSERIKKIAVLSPKAGHSREAFTTYWRETHGPLVATSPGYGAWRSSYAQNHVLGPGPVGAAFAYAGMAVFRLPGGAPNEDAFAGIAIYRDRIRRDELNFIDMDQTISMSADETVIRPGTGTAKIVILRRYSGGRRRGGLADGDLQRRFAAVYADVALSEAGFARRVRGWAVSHVIAGSFRLPGARGVAPLAVDCIEDIWFDTAAEAQAAYGALHANANVAAASDQLFARDGSSSFLARELVFFNDGRPTALAGVRGATAQDY